MLLPISPGHALSVLDSLALVPLLGGTLWVYGGLWARRGRLRERVGARPGAGVALAFAAGLGMGLLVASASSTFFWWFLLGAAVIANALLVAVAWAR